MVYMHINATFGILYPLILLRQLPIVIIYVSAIMSLLPFFIHFLFSFFAIINS